MPKLSVIKDLVKKKKISLKELSSKVSISEAGLHHIIKNNTTKIENIEKIAEFFDVPVTVFFDDKFQKANSENKTDNKELERLKKQIDNLTEINYAQNVIIDALIESVDFEKLKGREIGPIKDKEGFSIPIKLFINDIKGETSQTLKKELLENTLPYIILMRKEKPINLTLVFENDDLLNKYK